MNCRITILCENSVGGPLPVLGEHGFSCFIETPHGNLLFDAGQGYTILHNALQLGVDLRTIKRIVLSHGHYDHGGGLAEVLKIRGSVPVTAHPDVFRERYWIGDKQSRYIGLPHTRPYLETLGACFQLQKEFTEIMPGVSITGSVPRTVEYETGYSHLCIRSQTDDGFTPDPFLDDFSLLIDSASGPILLLGCAHAGLINILEHIRQQTGISEYHAIIGGTHLGPASPEQFQATMTALDGYRIKTLAAAHCTGLPKAGQLQTVFKGQFRIAHVGAVFEG